MGTVPVIGKKHITFIHGDPLAAEARKHVDPHASWGWEMDGDNYWCHGPQYRRWVGVTRKQGYWFVVQGPMGERRGTRWDNSGNPSLGTGDLETATPYATLDEAKAAVEARLVEISIQQNSGDPIL